MSKILVTPLSAVRDAIRHHRPSHLVTLLSPGHMIETPEGIPGDRHLRLAVNDVTDGGHCDAPPAVHHIEGLLAFGRGWPTEAPLLVHCWAGVSRSTAAAYILLCDRIGSGREWDVARALRNRAPHACPNSRMVRLADEILQRNGSMVAAVRSIGHGIIVAEGSLVELPITLGAS